MGSFGISRYTGARLKYFDKAEAEALCSACGVEDPQSTVNALYANPGLADLSRRPITLRMLIESLKEGVAALPVMISSADLYRMYTDKWLARDNWRSAIQIVSSRACEDFKASFVERMAWQMYISNAHQVSTDFVEAQVHEFFGGMKEARELIPAFANEIRLCSFLDLLPTGALVFSHKSFFDYFVARYLASLPVRHLVTTLSERPIDRTVFSFLISMQDWREVLRLPEFDAHLSGNSVLALNLVTAAHCCGSELLLTGSLPAGAEALYEGPGPVVLELIDSSLEGFTIDSKNSSDLTIRRCSIKTIKISCGGSIRLTLDNVTIGNLIIRTTGRLRIEPTTVKADGGELHYGDLELVNPVDASFSSVVVMAPVRATIEDDGSASKTGLGRALTDLGFSIKRPTRRTGRGWPRDTRHTPLSSSDA